MAGVLTWSLPLISGNANHYTRNDFNAIVLWRWWTTLRALEWIFATSKSSRLVVRLSPLSNAAHVETVICAVPWGNDFPWMFWTIYLLVHLHHPSLLLLPLPFPLEQSFHVLMLVWITDAVFCTALCLPVTFGAWHLCESGVFHDKPQLSVVQGLQAVGVEEGLYLPHNWHLMWGVLC